jgi:hypothetical protein
MLSSRAYLLLLPMALAAPHAAGAKALSVDFTVSNTEGFNGVDAARLTLTGHVVTGTVTVISPDGTFPCAVNAGSTDINKKLKLRCTIGPEEIVSFTGKLSARTGFGMGKFTESFFKETGTYSAKF